MSERKEMLGKYGQAVGYLPPSLRGFARGLTEEEKIYAEEFRLRIGRRLSICINGREQVVTESALVKTEDLTAVLELATKSSVHTVQHSIGEGYVTVWGGHRIGICGTMVKNHDGVSTIRDLSSISIRIAKSVLGAAGGIPENIMKDGIVRNTIIISPPGYGKTTMLRDLIRRISDTGYRVAIVDERGEIAAKRGGVSQFDVGRCTDILDGVNKAIGAMFLLRAMNPHIIALDEITDEHDADAIGKIANCGVGILATAHGSSVEDFFTRPAYRRLEKLCVFERAVILRRKGKEFSYEIAQL